jgi:hypothetical protein
MEVTMKTFLTSIFLICAAILLVSPPAGFAYQNVNQGCLTCHPTAAGTGLHTVAAHSSCGTCHTGGVPGQNVLSSACIVCHPRTGTKGLCPLIDAPVHASTKATCLGCHSTDCAPATTTTIVTPTTTSTAGELTPTTTTTTPEPTTTTTTAPATNCITIEPNEVTVDGILNKNVDITATFTRTDLIEQGITMADLETLIVSTDSACLNYITVNSSSVNYEIGNTQITATIPITVKGNAPTVQCKIVVEDPQKIATPPLNCEATFNIISAEACAIKSIIPSSVRIGFGIIPRIQTITITLNKNIEEAGITPEDLSFGQLTGALILDIEISGDQIIARVLFWGTKPGTYNVNLGPCGSIPFEVKRF